MGKIGTKLFIELSVTWYLYYHRYSRRNNSIEQSQKEASLHYSQRYYRDWMLHTTVMSTIIRAVNINLHPTGNGNITPIILSCDRDNTAVEGSKDGASYFLAAYYTGLFGAWRWINHFNMALVEGAIRRCSLRLIKSETLSLLPWHPFEKAEGEDEMLNISGLCLPAAAEQSESLLPIATFV